MGGEKILTELVSECSFKRKLLGNVVKMIFHHLLEIRCWMGKYHNDIFLNKSKLVTVRRRAAKVKNLVVM